MSDETTAEMLAEIDRDLADIEKAVFALQQAAANYPQQVETTTDRLAEIEGQAADYTPPEGWRVLQEGEVLEGEDWLIDPRNGKRRPTLRLGHKVEHQIYIRRIEPEQEPETEPQPVHLREGRWRTRGGEIRNVTRTPAKDERAVRYSWHDADHDQTWLPSGRYHTDHTESPLDLWEYLGPIESEPEQTITPDDVAAEALAGVNDWPSVQTLRRQLETTEAALLEQQQQNEELVTQGSQQRMQIAELQAQVRFLKGQGLTLGTRLEEEKSVATKRLETIQELRSEVSQIHRQWGDSRWRVEELEQKLAEAQPQPVHQQAMIDAQAETIARLNSEIHELNIDIAELETLLEAVKAELVRQCENSRLLQIELDAREQVPQAVSDRFEEGWDKGTAQAVETIAEWTEPFRTCGSQGLSYHVMQNLPHIMRTLTGLADND